MQSIGRLLAIIDGLTRKRDLSPRGHAIPFQPPGRNSLCPCGNGKKYKVCCKK